MVVPETGIPLLDEGKYLLACLGGLSVVQVDP